MSDQPAAIAAQGSTHTGLLGDPEHSAYHVAVDHPLLVRCAESVVVLAPARAAAVFATVEGEPELVRVASAGDWERVEWLSAAVARRTFAGAAGVVAPPQPGLDENTARVVLPLRVAGRAVGVLAADVDASGLATKPASAGRLAQLAEVTAAALDVVTQAARTAQNARRALKLEEILRELTVPLSLERTLDTVLKRIFELVPCDLAFVALHDPGTGELVITAALGAHDPAFQGWRVPVGEGLSGMVFAARRPLYVRDYQADPRVRASKSRSLVDREGIRSLVGVPIATTREALGVLCVCRRTVNPFTEDDARLLQGLAYHASVALEQARMAERERQAIRALAEANEALQRQNALLERLTTIHTRLTAVILEGGSLEGITGTIAEVLDGTIAVVAPSLQALALAGPSGEATVALPLLLENSPVVDRDLLDQVRAQRRVATLTTTAEGQLVAYAVAPIMAGEELLGYLLAARRGQPFADPERQALAHGTAAAALELLRQRARHEGQLHAQADLLADLLAGDYESEAEARHRALGLGYRLDRPHVLLVADVDALSAHVRERGVDERSVQRLKHALLTIVRNALDVHGLRGLVLSRSDSVVVAVALPEREAEPQIFARRLAERIQAAASQRLRDVSLSIGIGRLVRRPADFRAAHRDAERALGVAKASGRRGCILSYEELRMYRVLFETKDPALLRAATAEQLGPLLRLGGTKGPELLRTLACFLEHNGACRATASALGIHPHSLRYRLGRIERLLGVRLDDAETRMHLHLAIRVQRFLDSGVF